MTLPIIDDLSRSFPESTIGTHWELLSDRVMGGVSSSRLRHDPAGHAIFEGNVSLDVGNYDDLQSVAVTGTTALIGVEDNSVKAVDLATGDVRWDDPINHYESSSLASPQVVLRDGVVYATGIEGVLTARGVARGEVVWDHPLDPSGATDSYYSLVGAAAVTADRVYVATYYPGDTNYLHALDRATGAQRWRIELPAGVSGRIRQVGDVLLVPAKHLYALDPATGRERWRFAMADLTRGAGTPVVAGDAVLVQGSSTAITGRLYCLDLATGRQRWAIDAGNDYTGVYTPLVVGNYVLGVRERGSSQSTTGNGIPFVADLATGALVWANPDVSVESSPVWANGRLYFFGQNFKGTGGVDNNVGLLTLDATTGAFVSVDTYFRYRISLTPVVIATNGVFTSADDAP